MYLANIYLYGYRSPEADHESVPMSVLMFETLSPETAMMVWTLYSVVRQLC